MEQYKRNTELKNEVDDIFNDLKSPHERVRFGPGATPEEVAKMKIIEINPAYHLLNSAPLLASRDILLIGGWDDHHVSIGKIILPLYRALKNENASKVKITAVQDKHFSQNSSSDFTQIIINWLKPIDKKNVRNQSIR
jgi:hypothetical protein